jgi:hypothetical protein
MNSNLQEIILIQETIEKCKNLDEYGLLAGIFILSKDSHEFLSVTPREDDNLFVEVYSEYLYEDSFRFSHSPSIKSLVDAELPHGIVEKAVTNVIDITDLTENADAYIHEWTVGPGKMLFNKFTEKFKEKFKDTICGIGGPYKEFEEGRITKLNLPTAMVTSILGAGFTLAGFWIPLVVYIVLLLIKTGLKMYCED